MFICECRGWCLGGSRLRASARTVIKAGTSAVRNRVVGSTLASVIGELGGLAPLAHLNVHRSGKHFNECEGRRWRTWWSRTAQDFSRFLGTARGSLGSREHSKVTESSW